VRYLLLAHVQAGNQSHTVRPGSQQQHPPFPRELDESLWVALANKHQADDQATTPDRPDQLRKPPRKPLQPAKQKSGRPVEARDKVSLAQSVQYMESDRTCKRRPAKGCSMRSCSRRVNRSPIYRTMETPVPAVIVSVTASRISTAPMGNPFASGFAIVTMSGWHSTGHPECAHKVPVL
jgi:hypothetical protein